MILYVLEVYGTQYEVFNDYIAGIYSSKDNAEDARENLPGDQMERAEIHVYELDVTTHNGNCT